MSINGSDRESIALRAARADARIAARLATAIDDYFLPQDERLDDRVRAGITATLNRLIGAISIGIAHHAGRLMAQRGVAEASVALSIDTSTIVERLAQAGLLRDVELMREVEARVRQDLVADALTGEASEGDRPGLLARLGADADLLIARAARSLAAAEGRRRNLFDGMAHGSDLSAELHHRLVWWVTAALRERSTPSVVADQALADAALRSLAAHDEGERLEAAAMRLAIAMDADAPLLFELLPEALADRRLALFIALIAHALGLGFEDARALILDPADERLWLILRALEADRGTIARIGLALAEADSRRDLERFAAEIDAIMGVPSAAAREAIGMLRLHPDLRAAVLALETRRPA